ncbi:hypothetical protein JHK87_016265 [Glycine soja]|nr:hypothetical protein JHK87_016265 [Glycine soja]
MLNWKDQKGNTVLHVAALNDHIEAVSLLLTMVDLDAKNLEGKTASDIASSEHMRSILIRDPGHVVASTDSINSKSSIPKDGNSIMSGKDQCDSLHDGE